MVVLKVDGNILVQGTLEGLVFDYIKWVLVQVKVEQTQQEIQYSALKSLLAICDKLPKPRLNEILPGFSSTITKVLSNDTKVHLKIKLQMIEIWKVILQSVFDNKKVNEEEKNQGQIKLKLMKQLIQVTKNIEGKLEEDLQIKNSDESEIRLNDCFKYIMDNIYKSIDQNKVIEGQQSLTSKLLLKLERNSILLLNILLLNRLCGGNFVLKQSSISITLKQKIYEQFHQSIIRLKKTKNMINTNERTIALKRLSTLTELMQQLDINISNREDIPLLFANFSSLIVFESQRFMIQEVKKVDLEKIQKLQIDQASQEVKEFKLKKESQLDIKVLNEKYVREYFQQSIEIFQEDSEFQIQFALILQSLPDSFKIEMMDILFNDLLQLDNQQKQDTSKTLQQRCIGLSSSHEAVSRLSKNILQRFIEDHSNCNNLNDILQFDNGYYFHNLFIKLKSHSSGNLSQTQHQSDQHTLLILQSLKDHTPQLLESVLYELIKLVIDNIDRSVLDVNQRLILLSIDIAEILSQHIRDYSVLHKIKHQTDELKDEMRAKFEDIAEKVRPNKSKSTANILRKLILRLQPYISPNTKPIYICIKSCEIFKNLCSYLKEEEIFRETNVNDPFTVEDPENVKIPCALSAISYELYPNLLQILKHPQAQQHKIKLFEVLTAVAEVNSEFLLSIKRFEDDIAPEVEKLLKTCLRQEDQNSIGLKLVKEIIKFIKKIQQAFINESKFEGAYEKCKEIIINVQQIIDTFDEKIRVQPDIQNIIAQLN
eukprot:403335497